MYPDLPQWQSRLAAQANGYSAFFLFICLVAAAAILVRYRFPSPMHNIRTIGRMIVVGFVGLLLLLIDTPVAINLIVGSVALFVVYQEYGHFLKRFNPLFLVLILAGVLRLPLLNESLWYDEAFTAALARLPLPNLFEVVRADVHPPGWYIIEWLTVRVFGSHEVALRLPSYLAGIAAVILIHRLTIAMKLPQRTALLAALLLAVLPAHIYYSSEARAYSLLVCVAFGVVIAILENRPVLFALLLPTTLLLHNTGYLYTAVFVVVALVVSRRFVWLFAMLPAYFLTILWLPFMQAQAADVSNGFWLQFTLPAVVTPLSNMMIGWRMPDQFLLVTTGVWNLLILLALFAARRWLRTPAGYVWLSLALATPALAAIISLVWHPVYLERALLPCFVAFLIPLAYALTHAAAGDRFTARILLIPVLLITLAGYLSPGRNARLPFNEFVRDGCSGADVIFNTSVAVHFLTTYYDDRPTYLWRGANDLNQTLPEYAKMALQWHYLGAIPPAGKICILHYKNLLSSAAETGFVAHLLKTQTLLRSTFLAENSLGQLTAYVIEVRYER